MKATKIYYKRLFSLGNYQNEEIGIEIEIEEGEKAVDVLQKAKLFVSGLDPKNENERKYNEAIDILKYKENYAYKKVIESEEIVRIYEANKESKDELPF
jgi:hypothetical protein